jgi:hypothetical protein
MYLVYIMQNKGYPVNQVFDQEVKNIPTLRFQEFLDKNPDISMNGSPGGNQTSNDDHYSFHTEDSFDLLVTGPMIRPRRPSIVPMLNIYTLPEYESSSEEGDAE